jgi:hypothetical protein
MVSPRGLQFLPFPFGHVISILVIESLNPSRNAVAGHFVRCNFPCANLGDAGSVASIERDPRSDGGAITG